MLTQDRCVALLSFASRYLHCTYEEWVFHKNRTLQVANVVDHRVG